ncbi:MAG: ABC transporter ATP-binding protein, partial [Lentisphaerae bacterium]|nr:ABC transporter ATP-binding protein [Lentisphaerota bacterium]
YRVCGRLSSLIEVGAGFHPELTGRENVYLNAAILGMSKKETAAKFDEIVEFAELGDFIDVPVKRYSSGMYVRLGFSVAIHTEPDVLLVDEVLAVGDVAFRNKCFRRMAELRERTAMIFVSHNLSLVSRICQEALLLDHGGKVLGGETETVIGKYGELTSGAKRDSSSSATRRGSGPLSIDHVETLDPSGQARGSFACGEDFVIRVHYSVEEPVEIPEFRCVFFTADDLARAAVVSTAYVPPEGRSADDVLRGSGHVDFRIISPVLAPRRYMIHTGADAANGAVHDSWYHQHYVDITGGRREASAGGDARIVELEYATSIVPKEE